MLPVLVVVALFCGLYAFLAWNALDESEPMVLRWVCAAAAAWCAVWTFAALAFLT